MTVCWLCHVVISNFPWLQFSHVHRGVSHEFQCYKGIMLRILEMSDICQKLWNEKGSNLIFLSNFHLENGLHWCRWIQYDSFDQQQKFRGWTFKSQHKQPGRVTQQLSCDPQQQWGTQRWSSICPLKTIKGRGKRRHFQGLLKIFSIQIKHIKKTAGHQNWILVSSVQVDR